MIGLVASACGGDATSDPASEEVAAPVLASTQARIRSNRHDLLRRAQIRERAGLGPADVVLLGDSITEGWHRDGRPVTGRAFAGMSVANLGVSGDRTEHLLGRLPGDLEGFDPRLIVLMIGTNNLEWDGPADVVAGVGAIVAALADLRPDAEILLLALLPRGFEADSAERRAVGEVNALLERTAREWPVVWLDVGAAITEPDGRLDKKISPDGLHLSPIGYAHWWLAIKPSLDALLAHPHE